MKAKNLLMVLVSIMVIMVMAGCGNESNTNKSDVNVDVNMNTDTKAEVKITSTSTPTPTPTPTPTAEAKAPVVNPDSITFTEAELKKVETTFNAFLENEEYQTTVQDGDMLVEIKFKDIGTVTFKMYTDTAPKAIEWFTSLAERKVETVPKGYNNAGANRFYFVTTEREYNREEEVEGIFPMKYCLYQKLYSCHTFYFCVNDYIENDIDNNNFNPEYIEYLKKYGGNLTVYEDCIVLGRAVKNAELLDALGDDYVIESIKVK